MCVCVCVCVCLVCRLLWPSVCGFTGDCSLSLSLSISLSIYLSIYLSLSLLSPLCLLSSLFPLLFLSSLCLFFFSSSFSSLALSLLSPSFFFFNGLHTATSQFARLKMSVLHSDWLTKRCQPIRTTDRNFETPKFEVTSTRGHLEFRCIGGIITPNQNTPSRLKISDHDALFVCMRALEQESAQVRLISHYACVSACKVTGRP